MRFEKEKDGEDYLEACSLLTKIVALLRILVLFHKDSLAIMRVLLLPRSY